LFLVETTSRTRLSFIFTGTHRIGQESVCNYDYLCAEDSLDEKVLNKIQKKFGVLDHIIDNKENKDGFDILETEAFDRVFEEEEVEEVDMQPAAKRMRD